MGIKQPPGYSHPGKHRKPDEVQEPEAPARVESAGRPIKKKKKEDVRPAIQGDNGMVQVRLVVYPPAEGQLPLYDEMMAAGYSPRDALLGMLKKGFANFETELLSGKLTAPAKPLKTEGKPVDTTRAVSPDFMAKAQSVFDPFDMLSKRALGQRIAETILRYAAKEFRNGRR